MACLCLVIAFDRVDFFLLDVKYFNKFPIPNVPAYHICEAYPLILPLKNALKKQQCCMGYI